MFIIKIKCIINKNWIGIFYVELIDSLDRTCDMNTFVYFRCETIVNKFLELDLQTADVKEFLTQVVLPVIEGKLDQWLKHVRCCQNFYQVRWIRRQLIGYLPLLVLCPTQLTCAHRCRGLGIGTIMELWFIIHQIKKCWIFHNCLWVNYVDEYLSCIIHLTHIQKHFLSFQYLISHWINDNTCARNSKTCSMNRGWI